jgi:uncharacterized protein YwgA
MSARNALKIAAIVQDAGGKVVGRTRLQKLAYLLLVTGCETDLEFKYKHYGPFSEDVAVAAREGNLLGLMHEEEKPASWGGAYSIYTVSHAARAQSSDNTARVELATLAAAADAVELELAATAVFLAQQGYQDAWGETARRKPEKAEAGRIDRAKGLLRQMSAISFPVPLPAI